jgi:putative redox protein
MVEIAIEYLGELRCQATHGPSGTKMVTDAPTDNMGRGESFSPNDLVATALGTCMLTIMGIVAQRDGIDLAGTRVKVTKEMAATPVRRIGRLTVEFHVPARLSEADQIKLQKAALTCPVHKSLHPEIDIPIDFHFGSPG